MAVCPSVCLSVCLSQVGIISKRLTDQDEVWFSDCSWLVLHCVGRQFGYLQNKGTLFWNFVPNLVRKKISQLRLDCHVWTVEWNVQPSLIDARL